MGLRDFGLLTLAHNPSSSLLFFFFSHQLSNGYSLFSPIDPFVCDPIIGKMDFLHTVEYVKFTLAGTVLFDIWMHPELLV